MNVLHSTSITEYYQAGLQSWPDRTNFRFLRWFLSEDKMNRITSRLVLRLKIPAKPFNTLAKKYGLQEFRNFIELLEGDYILLADIPEWVGLAELRPNVRHIGPLPYRSGNRIPEAVAEVPKDKPVVFTDKDILHGETRVGYTIDPTTDPKLIDVAINPGREDERTFEGIYLLTDDELTLCLNLDVSRRQRPAAFSTEGEGSLIVLRLERAR